MGHDIPTVRNYYYHNSIGLSIIAQIAYIVFDVLQFWREHIRISPRNPLKNLARLSNDVRKENVNDFLKNTKIQGEIININIITRDNIIIHSVCVCVAKKSERQNNMFCDNNKLPPSFLSQQKRFTDKNFSIVYTHNVCTGMS